MTATGVVMDDTGVENADAVDDKQQSLAMDVQ